MGKMVERSGAPLLPSMPPSVAIESESIRSYETKNFNIKKLQGSEKNVKLTGLEAVSEKNFEKEKTNSFVVGDNRIQRSIGPRTRN